MDKATGIDLEPGEAGVVHTASRIFAAYIANGEVQLGMSASSTFKPLG